MSLSVRSKLIVVGIMTTNLLAVISFISMRANDDIAMALWSGAAFRREGPLVAELRLAGRELALDAIPSPAERRAQRYARDRVAAFDEGLERIRENLGALLASRDESERAGILLEPSRTLLALERKVTLDLRRAVDTGAPEEELLLVLQEIGMLADELDGQLSALADESGGGAGDEADTLVDMLSNATTVTLYVSLAGIGIVIALFVVLARAITRPLAALAESMEALADGRMETEIPGQARRDETGRMAKALQRIKETLASSRRR